MTPIEASPNVWNAHPATIGFGFAAAVLVAVIAVVVLRTADWWRGRRRRSGGGSTRKARWLLTAAIATISTGLVVAVAALDDPPTGWSAHRILNTPLQTILFPQFLSMCLAGAVEVRVLPPPGEMGWVGWVVSLSIPWLASIPASWVYAVALGRAWDWALGSRRPPSN